MTLSHLAIPGTWDQLTPAWMTDAIRGHHPDAVADQAASGVRGLAKLHSAFWGERTTGNPALGWLEPFVAFAGLEYAPLEIAHERMGDSVPAEIPALTGTELFVDIWARYIGTLTEAPQTLLHGDPHIGNTYVLPDDTVGFLDWQMARRATSRSTSDTSCRAR
jgi:aminoglycoside phosphotransferase (APT) family kinase protein